VTDAETFPDLGHRELVVDEETPGAFAALLNLLGVLGMGDRTPVSSRATTLASGETRTRWCRNIAYVRSAAT